MKINKDNYVIGITGGIGAGKSLVLYYLENDYGASIYNADRIGGSLTAFEGKLQNKIVELFGDEIVMEDGSLSRSKIAEIIYNDDEKYKALNSIIHPIVRRFLAMKANMSKGLVILEAALPIEAGFKDICDEIWYIHADEDIRRYRLMDSRQYSEEKCNGIFKKQLSEAEFKEICDRTIENGGTFDNTQRQIDEIMKELKEKGLPIEGGHFDRSGDCGGTRR